MNIWIQKISPGNARNVARSRMVFEHQISDVYPGSNPAGHVLDIEQVYGFSGRTNSGSPYIMQVATWSETDQSK